MSKIVKLTDIVSFIGGSQPPKSVFSDVKKDGYIRLIQIRDYKSDNHIIYIKKDSTKKFCTKDDIMIGRYGPPVFQILRGLEGAYNVALMKATPKTDNLSKEYLFRFLQSPSIQNYIIALSQRSAGQSGVNKVALEEYELILPTLSEQQRIVSKLDKLFEKINKSIALHKKNMDEADVFRGSILNEVFRELEEKYPLDNIGNMIEILTDYHSNGAYKTLKANVELLDTEDYALMIRATDLEKKDYSNNVRYITEKAYHFMSKSKVYGGEIILPKIGTIGSVYFMPYLNRPTSLAMNIFMLRCSENILNKYLFSYLKSPKGHSDILSRANGAVTKTITKDAVRSIELPLPPLNIQQKVVAHLDKILKKIEKIKSVQKEKMESLVALKASILDQAFRGEL